MKQRILLFVLGLLLTLPALSLAQPGLPGDPQQSPLGGLEILAVIGGGYAIKKLARQNGDEGELQDRNRN